MDIKVKRINKEAVKPVKFVDEVDDKRPVKGADIFPEIYANIFLCARKKSGKSCVIYHTIQQCATVETRVIAFSSTLKRDPTWRAIEQLCEKMKIQFDGFTSIKDPESKEDILDTIVKTVEAETHVDEKPDKKSAAASSSMASLMDEPTPSADGKKRKRPKERAPKIIFIFDDLSGELKAPSVTQLMKKNRHLKCKLIIASQYWNDVDLQARKQIDYVLIFRGLAQSLEKLKNIYDNCDLSVPFELFVDLYRFCTSKQYHFLWIDVVNSEFRKDFNFKIEVSKDEEDAPDDRHA
jgi:hypothetical protein